MHKISIRVLLLLFAISLAAYAPLLGTYHFIGDDYYQFDKSISEWFESRGIWRIIGIPLPGWLVSQGMYGISVITAHAIGGYFFFLVARRGFGSITYALLLTIIMMAFPWGYEALVWASAAAYAFASCLLWMILWALISVREDQRGTYALAATLVFASFLCLLMHEAVFFSLCVAGFVVLTKPAFLRNWKSNATLSLAPLTGALLWGVTYELTKPAAPIFAVTHLHPQSALSALLHQYRSLEVFEVWTNEALRSHALSTVQSPMGVLTLLAFCAVALLVGSIIRAARLQNGNPLRQQKTDVKPIAFLIWMLLLCGGAALIYVLAGGYSADSRKSYVIMPLMIISAGAAAWLIWERQRFHTFQTRTSAVVISTVCVFGCLTSLLMTSLYKMEMKRFDLLAHLIVHNRISDDLHVDWKPDLRTIWPRSVFDSQTLVDRALIALGHNPVLLSSQSMQRAVWRIEEQRWHCCSETVDGRNRATNDAF